MVISGENRRSRYSISLRDSQIVSEESISWNGRFLLDFKLDTIDSTCIFFGNVITLFMKAPPVFI
jgi:hypothetical protein